MTKNFKDLFGISVSISDPHWRFSGALKIAFGKKDGVLYVSRSPDYRQGWYRASSLTTRIWELSPRESIL